MAEETLPIFKSEGEAFDRAKINAEIRSGNTGAVTAEVGDSMRAAEKATTQAKSFYDQVYNDELKALDPAYDKNDPFYQYAYAGTSSDKKDIQEKIEEGQAVDGKEIVPMAKQAAGTKVGNAKALKSGTVTQIAEQIGIKEIKSMEEFETVSSDFNSKTKDESLKFDTLLSAFSRIIGQLNEGLGIGAKLPKETELKNNAIISALAKILSAEGIRNESISKMAERYEENLKNLISSKQSGIEGIKQEEKKPETPEPTAEVKSEEQKIEAAIQPEKSPTGEASAAATPETAQTAQTIATPTETGAIESATPGNETAENKEVATVAEQSTTQIQSATEGATVENKEALSVTNESVAVTQEQKIETPTAETKTGTVTPSGETAESKPQAGIESNASQEQTAKGSSRGSEFLKSIFGVSGGETTETGNGGKKFMEGIFGGGGSESETSKTASTAESQVGKLEEKLEKVKPGITSNTGTAEKITKELSKKDETFTENKSIIQTDTQKLSAPIPQPPKETEKKETTSTETEQKPVTEALTTSDSSTSLGTTDQGNTNQVENTNTKTSGTENNEAMGMKMDAMINLLSQLNDTLSSPLLVTSSQKKFD